MKKGLVLFGIAGIAASASAQNALSFVFPGGNQVSPGGTLKVELWAAFDPGQYAFAAAALGVNGDPTGDFSNPKTPFTSLPQVPGTPAGGNVTGIQTGQLHFPLAGILANTANPIKIWEADWTDNNFTARTVNLSSASTKFDLYINSNGTSQSFLSSLAEAKGTIEVIPAPASLALLGLGGLVAGRRRR